MRHDPLHDGDGDVDLLFVAAGDSRFRWHKKNSNADGFFDAGKLVQVFVIAHFECAIEWVFATTESKISPNGLLATGKT